MGEIKPIASRVAYMAMQGNPNTTMTLTSTSGDSECLTSLKGVVTNLFYSFDVGKAHSEAYLYQNHETQETLHNWLIQDLKTADLNRIQVPWIIVFSHKTLYCNIDYTKPLDDALSNTNCGTKFYILYEIHSTH